MVHSRHYSFKTRVWATGLLIAMVSAVLFTKAEVVSKENDELKDENENIEARASKSEGDVDNLKESYKLLKDDLKEELKEEEKANKKLKKESKKKDSKIEDLKIGKSLEKNSKKDNKTKSKEGKKVAKDDKKTDDNDSSGKTITMNTSYYGMDCNGCSGTTASGYTLSVGQTTTEEGHTIVAVDPSVIPMDSIIKVTNPDGSSYNAIAKDTGGAIKGNRLDVLVESEAVASERGRHETTVEVIK